METKLTLSLDKEIIQKAKRYAKSQSTSLSHLVESFFYVLTTEAANNEENKSRKTPITDRLLGSVKAENADTEKLKKDYLMDKYINV